MQIQIVKFRFPKQDIPSINNFKTDEVNPLFVKISEAQTSDSLNSRATVYLGEKCAVLKVTTEESNSITCHIRYFNFSINTSVTTDAIGIYTLFSKESKISEGLLFSRSK